MRAWLAVLMVVALGLVGFTCLEAWPARGGPDGAAGDFQRMTGGLGMGSTAALYWDFSTFDPRLEADCACTLWPVPGGFLYSPEHRSTVWDPPENLWFAVTPEPTRAGEER